MKKILSYSGGTVRTCDFNDCQATKLFEYYNDKKFNLKFCSKHMETPYGDLSDITPIFDDHNYKLYTDSGDPICTYIGCEITNDLKCLYSAYWCRDHGRIITALRLSALKQSNKNMILSNKIKEFTYRKIYNDDLFKDILNLEKELNINTDASLNMKINKVHYEYSYENYKKFSKNINLKSSNKSSSSSPSSSSPSPIISTKLGLGRSSSENVLRSSLDVLFLPSAHSTHSTSSLLHMSMDLKNEKAQNDFSFFKKSNREYFDDLCRGYSPSIPHR